MNEHDEDLRSAGELTGPEPARLGRRQFLTGGAVALGAVGCGVGTEQIESGEQVAPGGAAGPGHGVSDCGLTASDPRGGCLPATSLSPPGKTLFGALAWVADEIRVACGRNLTFGLDYIESPISTDFQCNTVPGGPSAWLAGIDYQLARAFRPNFKRIAVMVRNCGMGYADIRDNVSNVGGSGKTPEQVVKAGIAKLKAFDPTARIIFVTEFSGYWFHTYAGRNPANFKLALKNVARWVREVAPEMSVYTSVTGNWWPSRGAAPTSDKMEDYVDIADPNLAGVDIHMYGEGDASDFPTLWKNQVDGRWGLREWYDFCARAKKRVACSEWGMTHHKGTAGAWLGDSPEWCEASLRWFAEHGADYVVNYAVNPGDGDHRWRVREPHDAPLVGGVHMPKAERKLKELLDLPPPNNLFDPLSWSS